MDLCGGGCGGEGVQQVQVQKPFPVQSPSAVTVTTAGQIQTQRRAIPFDLFFFDLFESGICSDWFSLALSTLRTYLILQFVFSLIPQPL